MRKLIYLGLLLAFGALLFKLSRGGTHEKALELYRQQGLGPDRMAEYRVELKAVQKSKGKEDNVLALVSGTLSQVEQSPGVFVSQWIDVTKLSTGANIATADQMKSLLLKTILTRDRAGEFEHFFAKDFPKEWFRMQLNVMQRLFVASSDTSGNKFQRKEKGEQGEYRVEFNVNDREDYKEITKKWLSYENPDVATGAKKSVVNYLVGKEGRLIGIDGDIAFVHKAFDSDTFLISLNLDLIKVSAKAPETKALLENELAKADDEKIKEIALETTAQSTIGYDEALKRLSGIDAKTDSRDVYLVFAAMKAELRANPERAAELKEKILATTARDEGAKRQLAAVFGAMAQSDQSSVANVLADLASECTDVFCKDQAIVALNDHTAPTVSSARKMLDLVKTKPDYDTQAAAVLAAGSIAHKIGDQIPEVPAALIDAYKDPQNQMLKRSVLAAMGNHGSAQYLPILKASLNEKESMVRGTALYSLRNIKLSEVNAVLTSAIEKEKDGSTVSEGIKAMLYRDLSAPEYERIANKIASMPDKDYANEATRIFLKAYDKNPAALEAAMNILKDKSSVPTVTSAVERALKQEPAAK